MGCQCLLHLHWQVGSFPAVSPGKPVKPLLRLKMKAANLISYSQIKTKIEHSMSQHLLTVIFTYYSIAILISLMKRILTIVFKSRGLYDIYPGKGPVMNLFSVTIVLLF